MSAIREAGMARPDRLRQEQIGRLKRLLIKYSQPRFQMFLILLVTISIGAGASFVLLKAGLTGMWLRYPVAAIVAYLAFLIMLRLWVQYKFSDLSIAPDADAAQPEPGTESQYSIWKLRFIDFLDMASCGIDDFPVLFFIVAFLAILIVVWWIIIAAPALIAEVLVDGVLVTGLWHRFKRYGETSSLGGAVRATMLPAVIVFVGLGIIGFFLQTIKPGADSIGDLFRGGRY
jgi:hypothetical protein